MEYCVFDLETTYGKAHGRVSPPFDSNFRLVSSGWKFKESGYKNFYYPEGQQGVEDIPNLDNVSCLVGHNIKFDLLWVWDRDVIYDFLERGGKIWDTAYVEYLLSAQFYNLHGGDKRGISLKQVAKRRNCKFQKLDIVAALWDKGVQTEDIEPDVLLEYMKYDILTTEEIFIQQVKEARDKGMIHTIRERHEGLLATTEMEHNGLSVDIKTAREQQKELEDSIEEFTDDLNSSLPELPEGCNFNWGSWQNISALLYGGLIKYKAPVKIIKDGAFVYYKIKVKEPVIKDGEKQYYKSGKNAGKLKTRTVTVDDIKRGPKTRIESLTFELPRMVKPSSRYKSSIEGYWQTGEDVLKELDEKYGVPIITKILKLKGMIKDLGTYYEKVSGTGKRTGMLTCIQEDGFIHGSINHNVTVTTRLSSTSPNLQNIPKKGKSEIKRVFNSRFGEDGVICELDYSQLEVVSKAVLAEDSVRLEAILNGVDEHCEWLAFCENKPYKEIYELCHVKEDSEWKAKRQAIKSITFGKRLPN